MTAYRCNILIFTTGARKGVPPMKSERTRPFVHIYLRGYSCRCLVHMVGTTQDSERHTGGSLRASSLPAGRHSGLETSYNLLTIAHAL